MAAPPGGGGPPAPAAAGSGAAAACAACKYQRRRCAADCPLADYFPQDRPRVFRSAHRLFGVSNILKTLRRAGDDPDRRHEAMRCIVYESQAWDLYPSAGCVPIIHGLQQRIEQVEHELRRVHAELQAYRRDGQQQQMMPATTMINNAAAVTSDEDDGSASIAAVRDISTVPPQTMPPWTTTIQPPQYEHPFFVNATTLQQQLPGPGQFHYQHLQQPIVDDDVMDYFADDGIVHGDHDEIPRESRSEDQAQYAGRHDSRSDPTSTWRPRRQNVSRRS